MYHTHEYFMQKAITIAKQNFVSPNPMVGAILVSNHKIIAEGCHQKFGGPHAEINLFNSLPPTFFCDNTTLYISLEPCSHHGKTPPCVDQIIKRNIKTVVIASLDPNPLVAGEGVKKLQNAGITVIVGILEKQAQQLNEAFFKFISSNLPYVTLKSAISLDGKICTITAQSQWISSEESRLEVQYLRSQLTAIMVGINTVLADDPLLTSRIENGRNPIRIILDSNLRTPITSKLVQTASQIRTIISTTIFDTTKHQQYIDKGIEIIVVSELLGKIDLKQLMVILGSKKIDSILLEGGAEIAYSALEAKIVDKIQLYYAPIILGGTTSKSFVGGKGIADLANAFTLESYNLRSIGRDFVLEGYIK